MRKNKRLTDEQRADSILRSGVYLDESRNSGRTLGIALHAIGEAMMHPNITIKLLNHCEINPATGKLEEPCEASNVYVGRYVSVIIHELKLEHFDVAISSLRGSTITYNVFEDK